MANLPRAPKPAIDWTPNDLQAYNIRLEHQPAPAFFNTSADLPLPAPQVPEDVLTSHQPEDASDDASYDFLRKLHLATSPAPGEESAVPDFAAALLALLGYTGRARGAVARTRKVLPGDARADVCVVDGRGDVLLIVEEDKRHLGRSGPVPELVAAAIAAFAHNDSALDCKVIPGVTLQGTMPIFYKIPVTRALVDAVRLGEYPAQETVVYACVPDVPRPSRRYDEGMKPLDNRRIILSCFEAFKQFL